MKFSKIEQKIRAYLSQVLDLDEDFIAAGSLEYESFGAIQEKALKVLEGFILNPKTELRALFDETKKNSH